MAQNTALRVACTVAVLAVLGACDEAPEGYPNKITKTIQVGDFPVMARFTPDGRRLWVSDHNGGSVSVIDAVADSVIRVVPISGGPHGIAFTPNGEYAYVAVRYADVILKMRADDFVVTDSIAAAPGPIDLAMLPDGSRIYVSMQSSGEVAVVNTATDSLTNGIQTGLHAIALTCCADGLVYGANWIEDYVFAVRPDDDSLVKTISVGDWPWGIAPTADGKHLWVVNRVEGTVCRVSTESNEPELTTVTGGTNTLGCALLPGDKYLYATVSDRDSVAVIDAESGDVVGMLPAGDGVAGVVASPDGDKVYVTNLLDNTVTVYGR